MRTKKLNTGVIITFDKKDNMVSVSSPYHKDEEPTKISILTYAVNKLKQWI